MYWVYGLMVVTCVDVWHDILIQVSSTWLATIVAILA